MENNVSYNIATGKGVLILAGKMYEVTADEHYFYFDGKPVIKFMKTLYFQKDKEDFKEMMEILSQKLYGGK